MGVAGELVLHRHIYVRITSLFPFQFNRFRVYVEILTWRMQNDSFHDLKIKGISCQCDIDQNCLE